MKMNNQEMKHIIFYNKRSIEDARHDLCMHLNRRYFGERMLNALLVTRKENIEDGRNLFAECMTMNIVRVISHDKFKKMTANEVMRHMIPIEMIVFDNYEAYRSFNSERSRMLRIQLRILDIPTFATVSKMTTDMLFTAMWINGGQDNNKSGIIAHFFDRSLLRIHKEQMKVNYAAYIDYILNMHQLSEEQLKYFPNIQEVREISEKMIMRYT